jgi:hypothetical protein
MKKLIAVFALIGAMLAGCGETAKTPPQVLAWCQYSDFENNAYKAYADEHHGDMNLVTMSTQEKMLKDLRPVLKAEREKLFGPMNDDAFLLLQDRAARENWYKTYCQ